jgi:hypothetical protein
MRRSSMVSATLREHHQNYLCLDRGLSPPTSSAPSFWLSTVAIMQGNKPIAVVDKTLAG